MRRDFVKRMTLLWAAVLMGAFKAQADAGQHEGAYPATLNVKLDLWESVTFSYQGQDVTYTVKEMFDAIQGG